MITPYIWIPFIEMGGGSDISARYLSKSINKLGYNVALQPFPSPLRIAPHLLKYINPPKQANIALCDSRNAFVFARPELKTVSVERLFILDDRHKYQRSFAQRVYHEFFVKKFIRASYNKSDLVIAMSRSTAEGIKRVFPDVNPIVIPNGVDTEYFMPDGNDKRSMDKNSPFRLLFVGNITKRKGADLLPHIMDKLGDNFVLEYTSGNSPGIHLPDSSNMKCLGKLSQQEIRKAYQRAHALLFPSRLEGMPRAIMESMACGTPVIGSDTSSIPEIITNKVDGMLCDLDDPESFVNAAEWLRNNIEVWKEMTLKARATIVKQHSLDEMTKQYIKIFYNLLVS